MAISPETLRKAADVKSTLTTPSAEGVKGTTVEVAKGAAQGALVGGWVGAAKGAAVSFAQTKAGRRVIAVLLVLVRVNMLSLPVGIMIALAAVNSAASYGNDFRSGESAMASRNEQSEITQAMAEAHQYQIVWPVYLALKTVEGEGKSDFHKLESILSRGDVRTIGAAGVYVSGSGLVEGDTDREVALAAQEKEGYLAALTEYGPNQSRANKVYTMALKWAYGQTEECTTGENTAGGSTEDGSPITLADGTTVTLSDVQLGNAQKSSASHRKSTG